MNEEEEHAPQARPAAGVAGCIYIICLRRKTERLARFSCVLRSYPGTACSLYRGHLSAVLLLVVLGCSLLACWLAVLPFWQQGNPEFLVPGIQEIMGSSGIDY